MSVTSRPLGRQELLSWLNEITHSDVAKVEHCCDGVVCLKLLDVLHPGKVSFKKVNMSAKFPEDRMKNLKIVQKVFSSVGVALPCSIDKISKGQFQDNYDMLQFCYQHAQRIHPSTDFAAPSRPSSAAAAQQLQRMPVATFADAGGGRGGKALGRAPQGRNVAWNRLDDDAHPESSFEVTLRPGHAIHAARSLVVPPHNHSAPPAPSAPSSSSSSAKAPPDFFANFSGDKSRMAVNVVAARGRPQGRSVKWGELDGSGSGSDGGGERLVDRTSGFNMSPSRQQQQQQHSHPDTSTLRPKPQPPNRAPLQSSPPQQQQQQHLQHHHHHVQEQQSLHRTPLHAPPASQSVPPVQLFHARPPRHSPSRTYGNFYVSERGVGSSSEEEEEEEETYSRASAAVRTLQVSSAAGPPATAAKAVSTSLKLPVSNSGAADAASAHVGGGAQLREMMVDLLASLRRDVADRVLSQARLREISEKAIRERQFYLEKLEAIERLCLLAGNTSLNKGAGARLAVADAVLDVIAEVPVGFESGDGSQSTRTFDA